MLDLSENTAIDSIGEERRELVAVLDELDNAVAEAAATLEASRASNRAFRESIIVGQPLPEALASIKASVTLATVAETLKNLERIRHKSRTIIFAVGLEEGLSIGELARLYGFSRQLAQRFAKEARAVN